MHSKSQLSALLFAKQVERDQTKIINLSQHFLEDLNWWFSSDRFVVNRSRTTLIREMEPMITINSNTNLTIGGAHNSRGEVMQRLHLDSRTTASYFQKLDGTKSLVLTLLICKESINWKITNLMPHWLSTTGKVMADFLSRNIMGQWELTLARSTFLTIFATFQILLSLDVFASRKKAQLQELMVGQPLTLSHQCLEMVNNNNNNRDLPYLHPLVAVLLKT